VNYIIGSAEARVGQRCDIHWWLG